MEPTTVATVTASSADSAVIVTACDETTLWIATIKLLGCIDEVMMI